MAQPSPAPSFQRIPQSNNPGASKKPIPLSRSSNAMHKTPSPSWSHWDIPVHPHHGYRQVGSGGPVLQTLERKLHRANPAVCWFLTPPHTDCCLLLSLSIMLSHPGPFSWSSGYLQESLLCSRAVSLRRGWLDSAAALSEDGTKLVFSSFSCHRIASGSHSLRQLLTPSTAQQPWISMTSLKAEWEGWREEKRLLKTEDSSWGGLLVWGKSAVPWCPQGDSCSSSAVWHLPPVCSLTKPWATGISGLLVFLWHGMKWICKQPSSWSPSSGCAPVSGRVVTWTLLLFALLTGAESQLFSSGSPSVLRLFCPGWTSTRTGTFIDWIPSVGGVPSLGFGPVDWKVWANGGHVGQASLSSLLRSSANGCSWPCLNRVVQQDDLQTCLPTSTILLGRSCPPRQTALWSRHFIAYSFLK